MALLAIDTATEICTVALSDEHKSIDESTVDAGKSHLEMLLPEIYSLLNRNNLQITDINAIAVGTGPGTFSGLRVGIATARALAQSLQVPLSGVSTLRALALGMASGTGKNDQPLLMPVIDAKRGQVFAQAFACEEEGAVKELSDIFCLDPQELVSRIPSFAPGPILAAGNGVLAYWSLFEAARQVELIDRRDRRHLVHAAYHLSAAVPGAFKPRSLLEVLPVYVREPDADKTVLLRKRAPWLR